MDEKEKTLKYLAGMGIDVNCEQKRSKILYFSEARLTDEEICRVMLAGDKNDALQVLNGVRRRLLDDVHTAQAKLRRLDCCINCFKNRSV